jgi:hypothetical protein
MAMLTMVTCFGIGSALLAVYSSCFSDDNIFPPSKRATAIGICNVIARGLTILAPQVNESPVPIPMMSFNVAIALALLFSFTFASKIDHSDEK